MLSLAAEGLWQTMFLKPFCDHLQRWGGRSGYVRHVPTPFAQAERGEVLLAIQEQWGSLTGTAVVEAQRAYIDVRR